MNRIVLTAYAVVLLLLAVLGFLAGRASSQASSSVERSIHLARAATLTRDLAADVYVVDGAALKDILVTETILADAERREAAVIAKLEALHGRIGNQERWQPALANLDRDARQVVSLALDQLAMKSTLPREFEQHRALARQSDSAIKRLERSASELRGRLFHEVDDEVALAQAQISRAKGLAYFMSGLIILTVLAITIHGWAVGKRNTNPKPAGA